MRNNSEKLDSILGEKFNVLNEGFIRVVDYMGNDDSIVQAARVSYGKGTKKVSEDTSLIRYLMRNWHTTPFEMCEIKLHVKVPMDVWRQWIRHRMASVNEYSTRYSVAIDDAQKTDANMWRSQSKSNKQGSSSFLFSESPDLCAQLSKEEEELQALSRKVYEKRINAGVAREQARKDLPLSTYTEAYWKIDLHNLLHFLRLRMDSHAQFEIRQYANVIGEKILPLWVPITAQAFNDYRLNTVTFSQIDKVILAEINNCPSDTDIKKIFTHYGYFKDKVTREGDEFIKKCRSIGLGISLNETNNV